MAEKNSILRRVKRAGSWVELRLRLGRVARIAPTVLVPGLSMAAVLLAVHKIAPERLSERHAMFALVGVGASMLLALAVAFARTLPRYAGTILLDRHHGLSGRLTNALEFSELPETEQSGLMKLAVEETCELVEKQPRATTLASRPAAPIRLPGELLFAFVPAAFLVLIAMLEIRVPVPVAPPQREIDALVINDDDLDYMRDAAKDLERPDMSPEVKAAIERFNRLIEDLANKRLERTEAFRQMESIERDLLAGAEADQKKLQEELKETAKQLDKSDLAKDTAEALKKNELKQAEQKLKELAQKLRENKKPDKEQIKKLRDALKKASEKRKEALAAINEKRQELQEQLLQKKKEIEAQKDPKKKEEDERLLKKKERELERLDREAEAQQRANRELERLDRELSQAAQDLMREMGITPEDLKKAAESLEQAAEDLNRMEREGMSQKDKEELKKKLEELRQIMRQENQGGQKRKIRMERFTRRANGKSGSGEQGEGQDGEGKEPGKGRPGQDGQEGEEGDGEGKQGKGKGQGKGDGEGEGEGEGQGLTLQIGPGGVPIPVPGAGQGPGGDQPGDGDGKGGKQFGKGSGGPVAGNATKGQGDTIDVNAAGLETGQGPSNSQVILSAADKGFRGKAYKKVFTDYKTVAEENINQEQIPDGYRFYVQRYFQLIRPRD